MSPGDLAVQSDGIITVDTDIDDFIRDILAAAETGHGRRPLYHMAALHIRDIRQLRDDTGPDDTIVGGKDDVFRPQLPVKGPQANKICLACFSKSPRLPGGLARLSI